MTRLEIDRQKFDRLQNHLNRREREIRQSIESDPSIPQCLRKWLISGLIQREYDYIFAYPLISADDANQLYTERTGREPMTKPEKQQAFLNYLVECRE